MNCHQFHKSPVTLLFIAVAFIAILIFFARMNVHHDETQQSSMSGNVTGEHVVFDSETDAMYSPPKDWKPLFEFHEGAEDRHHDILEILRIAYTAKRGIQYADNRPILIEAEGNTTVIRFPADTSAPPGHRYRGPTWAATIVIDSSTLRVLSAIEDPN